MDRIRLVRLEVRLVGFEVQLVGLDVRSDISWWPTGRRGLLGEFPVSGL